MSSNKKEKNTDRINRLKEKLAALEVLDTSPPMEGDLEEIRKKLLDLEQQIFSQKILADMIGNEKLDNLLKESDVRVLLAVFRNHERIQEKYIQSLESLSQIIKATVSKNLGSIRYNLLLSKIRKHFLKIEKRRIPTTASLIEIEDYFESIKSKTNRDLTENLKDLMILKSAVRQNLGAIAEISNKQNEFDEKIHKFVTLMDFTATNGSKPFDDMDANPKNFLDLTSKLNAEQLSGE